MTTLYTTHLYKASLEGICALPLTHLRFHFANQSNGQIYNWVGAADVETLSEVLHAQRDTLRSVSISGVEMTMPIVTALTSLPRLDTLYLHRLVVEQFLSDTSGSDKEEHREMKQNADEAQRVKVMCRRLRKLLSMPSLEDVMLSFSTPVPERELNSLRDVCKASLEIDT